MSCVHLSVTYRHLNHWTDLHKIWYVSTVWPGDGHGLLQNLVEPHVPDGPDQGGHPEHPLSSILHVRMSSVLFLCQNILYKNISTKPVLFHLFGRNISFQLLMCCTIFDFLHSND